MTDNSTQIDKIVDSLYQKECPLHGPMIEGPPLRLHDAYIRFRFCCPYPSCECEVDFVGNEIKTDSVGRTIQYIAYSGFMNTV